MSHSSRGNNEDRNIAQADSWDYEFSTDRPPAHDRPDHSTFSWWVPCPASIIGTLLVCVALVAMMTLDHNLGKPLERKRGFPFVFQVVPHDRSSGALPVPAVAEWFDAGMLAADIFGLCALSASCYFTMRWCFHKLFGTSRLTVRSLMLTIVACAGLMALLQQDFIINVFVLLGAFAYGSTSPFFLVVILVCRSRWVCRIRETRLPGGRRATRA